MMNSFELWWDIAKKVVSEPGEFFKKMPKKGGYRDPVKFTLISMSISAAIFLAMLVLFFTRALEPVAILISVMVIPLMIGVGILGIFINGFIQYTGLKIVGGKATYEATVRIMSVLSLFSTLAWIPVVGVIASIYSIVVNVIACSKVHKISIPRSILGILLGGIIFFVTAVIVYLIFVGILSSALLI